MSPPRNGPAVRLLVLNSQGAASTTCHLRNEPRNPHGSCPHGSGPECPRWLQWTSTQLPARRSPLPEDASPTTAPNQKHHEHPQEMQRRSADSGPTRTSARTPSPHGGNPDLPPGVAEENLRATTSSGQALPQLAVEPALPRESVELAMSRQAPVPLPRQAVEPAMVRQAVEHRQNP